MRATRAQRLLDYELPTRFKSFQHVQLLARIGRRQGLRRVGSCLFGTARTIGAPRPLADLTRHGQPLMIELASPAESGLGVRVDAGQQFATLAPGVASQNLEPVSGRKQRTESLLSDPLDVGAHRAPRARGNTMRHRLPSMSFLAYPLKFRLPAEIDGR